MDVAVAERENNREGVTEQDSTDTKPVSDAVILYLWNGRDDTVLLK